MFVYRQKTSRIITYEEFQRALEELAPKKFKGQSKEEAVQSIFKLVEGKEPTNVGVTVRQKKLLSENSIMCLFYRPETHVGSFPSVYFI